MRHRHAIIAILALASVSVAASAQSELRPGTRIRITAPGAVAGRLAGTLLAHSADSLTIGSPSLAPLTIAKARIAQLEVSRGSSRAEGAKRGLLWAAPIGAGITALAAASARDCGTCNPERTVTAEEAANLMISVMVWGAGIGALMGRERWERLDLPVRGTSAILRKDGRPALGARFPF